MISFAALNPVKTESEQINRCLKDLAAILTREPWEMEFVESLEKLREHLKDSPLMDMGLFDVMEPGVIGELPNIREKYKESLMVLLADVSLSPMEYLRPGIRPDSLLLRPLSPENIDRVLRDIIELYLKRAGAGEGEVFIVETRDERTLIPFNGIYYFEAREKKLFLRTLNEEYGFYDSLETLADTLPQNFRRCHRSFVVNTDMISQVRISQGEIELTGGFYLPLSRSYRQEFKDIKREVSA